MQIIKHRQLAHSHWQYPDFAPAAASKPPAIMPNTLLNYRDWLALSEADKTAVNGIVFHPDDAIDLCPQDAGGQNLDGMALIGVYFPSFSEGRGYTQAAILRQQLRYKGELRAINVYRDNLALLAEVGFDAFDLHPEDNITAALLAFGELNLRPV